MKITLLFCCSVLLFWSINAQVALYDCPLGWQLRDKQCYQFVKSEVVFEQAETACQIAGATLVSVQSSTEHNFISDWLVRFNAFSTTSTWFTGGVYIDQSGQDGIIWSDDNQLFTGQTYWKQHPRITKQNIDTIFQDDLIHIAYVFGGLQCQGYCWQLVAGGTPASYICKIPLADAAHISTLDRGIDYGLGIVDVSGIARGPVIISEPDNIVIPGQTTSVYVECAASGMPPPSYTWWRRQEDTWQQVTSETSNRYTLSGGRFTIQKPESEDMNDYRCKAESELGSTLSQSAHVIFGTLGSFSPNKPKDQRATAFRGTALDCQAPDASPAARYEWYKFTIKVFVLPGHPYLFVSNTGLFYFSEVQPTDSKNYFCVVTLVAGDGYKLAHSQPPSRNSLGTYLQIDGGEIDADYGPIIFTHAFPTPALRGHTIRLECVAYGSLPLSYTWQRVGKRAFAAGTVISDRNRVLTIGNAQLDAEGGYICTCTRGGGSTGGANANKTITVNMMTQPYFPYPIGDMLVDDAQQLKWFCLAVARPSASYTWYKDGTPIENQPGEVEIRNNHLYIKTVNADRDEGMYQCAATNVYGTTYSTGQLRVLSFIPNFKRYPLPDKTLAPVGGNISIPCKVEAAPTPQVSWLKNGGDLNLVPGGTGGRMEMTIRNDLVIGDVTYGDAGRYTCRAANVNGEAANTTVVEVIRGIVMVNSPSATMVKVNNTAFFYCQAAYDNQYDISYVWYLNGHPIDLANSAHFFMGRSGNVQGLSIYQAQYKHRGLYECRAITTLHTESRRAYLTVVGPPGPPAGVYVDESQVTSYSARLIWTVGEEIGHGRPVMSYNIEGESHFHPGIWKTLAYDVPEPYAIQEQQNEALRPDQRSVVVRDLIPNTGYRFRVRALNEFGSGKEASKPSSTKKISATAPVLAPIEVSGGGGRVGTLVITWEPLDIAEWCADDIGYNVFWKKLGDTLDWKKHQVAGNVGQHVVTVGGDNYYMKYHVKVGSYNMYGSGPNSTDHIIFSAEGLPIGVPAIQDTVEINSTAVWVYWEPVPNDREHMRGKVQGYTIQYFEINGETEDFSPLDARDPDFIMSKEVYGQVGEGLIIGLQNNTNYYARVQVVNSAGRGPKGEWRLAETLHAAPGHYPRFVTVYPKGRHAVRVTWRGVSSQSWEESLLGYILRFWKISEDIRTARDIYVDKVMEAEIDGLQIHTVYIIRMLGYSLGGEGALSEHVYFTVLGGSVQYDPSTTAICYDHYTCDSATAVTASLHLAILLAVLATLMLRE